MYSILNTKYMLYEFIVEIDELKKLFLSIFLVIDCLYCDI